MEQLHRAEAGPGNLGGCPRLLSMKDRSPIGQIRAAEWLTSALLSAVAGASDLNIRRDSDVDISAKPDIHSSCTLQ